MPTEFLARHQSISEMQLKMGIRVLLLPALLLLLLLGSASSAVRRRNYIAESFNPKPWPNMHPPIPGGLEGRGGKDDTYGNYGGKL